MKNSRVPYRYVESKPPLPLWKYVIAGGVAGVIEILTVFPLDTAKVRLQLQRTSPATNTLPTNTLATNREYKGVISIFTFR